MTSSIYDAVANFQESHDWVQTVNNRMSQMVDIDLLQADIARLLHHAMAGRASRHNRHILRWLGLTLKALAHMSEVHVVLLEGYDESISKHDNWSEASKQRTTLQARLYSEIQGINIAQRTLTRDFCLAAFRTLVEPSPCTEIFYGELWRRACPFVSAVCEA